MTPRSLRGLAFLLLVALTLATARPEATESDAQQRRRRALLAGASTAAVPPQQISQCEWIGGEGCALHPSYVSYALNRTSNDVVARYVSSALSCASMVDKGVCEGVSYCFWDPAFTNGQQGCFLHDSAVLSLQQQCVKPQSRDSLGKLQACMAARHSCQCSISAGASSSVCQLRQQQLLSGYSSSSSKVCQSLLGCWLSSLNSSSPDITQLVEVQLAVVQPMLESLLASGRSASTSGTSSGRRRSLLQNLPSLSDPVLDDSASHAAPADTDFMFESGSYSSSSGKPAAGAASAGPSVGMNGVILTDDRAAAPSPAGSPVEYGKNIPGLSSSSGGGMNPAYQFESGTATEGTWEFESGQVDYDKLYGGSGQNGSSAQPGSGSSGSSGGSVDVQMTGGNAPASFWKCAGSSAVKADTTRKWADIDYNSKTLTLATWLKVIQPTALIDWGVQVMECFKAEVSSLSANAASDRSKPNKESMEYAIVALIRTFSAQADTFRTYLQAGPEARAAAGLTGLRRLTQEVLPDQLKNLMGKYNASTAYDRDVMLQAASLIADMQWFSTDALALASAAGSSAAQQQQVFEAVVSYGEEMMRRCLYWMFHVQFEGPPAHLPGVPTSTAASTSLMSAFDDLAAAAFPAPAVAADAPAWQQLQGMMAVAVGWASHAAVLAKPVNGQLDAAAQLGNAVDGLAKAHVQDFWGTRVELARSGAPDAARQLALLDPNQQAARWQPLRTQQVALLTALQRQVLAGPASDDASLLGLSQNLRDLVAASGSFLVGGPNANPAAQQQRLQEALKYSAYLASLVRQCHGSPVGLPALGAAAAAAAGVPAGAAAACTQLAAETNRMAAAALAASGDVLMQTLVANLNKQWTCNGLTPTSCSTTPGCQLALASTLVPGSAAAAAPASSANAELLLEGTAKSDLVLACQAADAGLLLSSMSNSTKSALAANPSCEQFLLMPDCEGLTVASTCNNYSMCRWELSSLRNLLHTAGGNLSGAAGAAAPSIAAASKGVCSMDWVEVLESGSNAAYASMGSMISLCSGIADTAACTAQTMMITMDTSAAGGTNMARIWVPALVVAAVLGVVLFGAAVYWRRRSTMARRAAEEAAPAGSGGHRGSGKKGKDGKDGKAKNKTIKKKVKRAEPGAYKPDLMRDSFTDYMRSAPQQFENGMAIAKAAMAAGSLGAAVAAADVAGGRPGLYQQQEAEQQLGGGVAGGSLSSSRAASPAAAGGNLGIPRVSGSLPPLPPASTYPLAASGPAAAGTAANTDLIDMGADVGVRGAAGPAAAPMGPAGQLQQGRAVYGPMNSMMYSGPVWGAAGGAGRLSGGGLSAGLSGGLLSGGLSGEADLIDTGASLALTSSLGLVSSLPHHASMQLGVVDAQQLLQGGIAGPDEVRLGLPAGVGQARLSSGSLGGFAIQSAAAAVAVEGANSGSLLLGRPSGDIEDGTSTPTSSCCHDSVCTFKHAAGSSVGSRPGPGSSSSSWRGSTRPPSIRAGSSSGAAAGAGGGLPSTLSGALSGALSRSSWSSAMSTDILLSQQPSSALDP